MFKGTVTLKAQIAGNGAAIESLTFSPGIADVAGVNIREEEDTLICMVEFSTVQTREEASKVATQITDKAFNRMALVGIVVENGRVKSDSLVKIGLPAGELEIHVRDDLDVTDTVEVTLAKTPGFLKSLLEQASLKGESRSGLFRSALLSTSHVERYMHLYNLLLMLFDDEQKDVDNYIRAEEPTVSYLATKPQRIDKKKPSDPNKPAKSNGFETVYSKLRNEFAHVRAGVNINDTKAERETRLGALQSLTLKAIVQYL